MRLETYFSVLPFAGVIPLNYFNMATPLDLDTSRLRKIEEEGWTSVILFSESPKVQAEL